MIVADNIISLSIKLIYISTMKMRVLQLCIAILMISHTTKGNYGCQPAEEGQPYQLSYTLTTIPAYRTMLLWLKDGHLVSECPVEAGDCSNNDISWFHATVTRRQNVLHFVLDILNVTRETTKNVQGVWALKTHSLEPTAEYLYSCALKTYAKAVDVACVSDLTTEGFSIVCNTSRIFPEAMITVTRNGHQLQINSCESYPISENPVYYKSSCKVVLPKENLHLDQNKFNISIYPNVIGFYNRENLLAVKFVILKIEPKSVVLQNCVNETSVVKCRCKRIDATDGVSKFDWYLNNSLVKQNSDVYTYKMSEEAEMNNQNANVYVVSKQLSCIIQPADNRNGKDTSILNFFVVLIVILILIILTMFFYTPNQCRKQFRKCLLSNWKTKTMSEKSSEEIPLSCRNEQLKNEDVQIEIDVATAQEPELVIDESQFEVKTTLLLLGTKGGKKQDIRDLILHKKNKDAGSDILRVEFQFSELDSRVIKLADGPELDPQLIHQFITELKHSIVFFPEGFNAILLVLNEKQETKDIDNLINVIVFSLGVDVLNHVIIINSSPKTSTNKKYRHFKDIYKDKILENFTGHTSVGELFALTDTWSCRFVCQSFKLFYDLGKLNSETSFERLFKMISLLLQACNETETEILSESLKTQSYQVLNKVCEKYKEEKTEIGNELVVVTNILAFFKKEIPINKYKGGQRNNKEIETNFEELQNLYLQKVILPRKASLEKTFTWKVIDNTRDKNINIPHQKYITLK